MSNDSVYTVKFESDDFHALINLLQLIVVLGARLKSSADGIALPVPWMPAFRAMTKAALLKGVIE